MNSAIMLMPAVAILLAARRGIGPKISGPIFALILLLHVTVIGGLMALHYWKHY